MNEVVYLKSIPYEDFSEVTGGVRGPVVRALNEDHARFSGPYYREDLEVWLHRSRKEHGQNVFVWELIESDDLPEDFQPTAILNGRNTKMTELAARLKIVTE